jgi:hypothetical protein
VPFRRRALEIRAEGEGSGDGERCPATQGNRLVQPRAPCARFDNPVIQILN